MPRFCAVCCTALFLCIRVVFIVPSSISIGSVTVPVPIYLAPMSGVSDPPFRKLARKLGAPVTVSEMIASREALRETEGSMKRLGFDDAEAPRIVQIAGHDPAIMADAARFVVDRGAEVVDINFGCPARKVTDKLCGSALMREEGLARAIMEAVARAVAVPVTIKMRLGWDDASRNADVFARMAEDVGIQAMTVHGRTRMQLYSGKADWAGVARVKQATRLPVIVNGDIDGVEAMNRALAESGADGVMLGRACYGRPWLVGQLAAVVAGQPMPPEPAPGQRLDLILEHYEDVLAHHGIWRGVLAARKHLAWYIRDYPGASELRQRIMGLDEPDAVRAALRAFFAPLPARLAA